MGPHDYFIEQNKRLPTSGEFWKMTNPHDDCEHKEIQDGYGLAGGGMGPYSYCKSCSRILCKDEDMS